MHLVQEYLRYMYIKYSHVYGLFANYYRAVYVTFMENLIYADKPTSTCSYLLMFVKFYSRSAFYY